MKQRLGIAAAMLGDPRVLILDEPANGLDPEGIRWMRDFLRTFAQQGRTVLVSSHLLGEMEQLADDVVIIAAGTLITQGPVADIVGGMCPDRHGPGAYAQAEALAGSSCAAAADVTDEPDGDAAGRRAWTRPRSAGPPWPPRSNCTSWSPKGPTWSRSSCSSRTARRASDEPPRPLPPATATARPPRLVRAELLKIRTTNTWWIFGILDAGRHRAGAAGQRVPGQRRARPTPAYCLVRTRPTSSNVPAGPAADPGPVARIMEDFRRSTDVTRVLAATAANIYTSGQLLGLMFIVMLGALVVTNEYFHQTATTTFLTTPQRTRVIMQQAGRGGRAGGRVLAR